MIVNYKLALNMNKHLKNIIFGILIGVSVMLPGLSGGTTALFIGNYYDILEAVGNIFSKKAKNVFLFELLIGVSIGIYFISFPLDYFLSKFHFEFSYAAVGILIGSFPMFVSLKNKPLLKECLYIIAGFASTVFLGKIAIISNLQIIIAFFISVAIILPGISLTNILISFNYYDKVVIAIKNLDFGFLMNFFLFVLIFLIILSGFLAKTYKKYPKQINLIVLGMIIASAFQVFPGPPNKHNFVSCALLMLFGLFFSLFIFFLHKRTDGV